MARVTCAISGLRFSCDYLECLNITNEAGYMHPIFAASQDTLYALYSRHCKGRLPTKDSYLLFLALLHSSTKITWKQPANVDPFSLGGIQLVENNITQLVRVLEQTAYIRHPSFSQPSFTVSEESSNLRHIPNFIRAWRSNVEDFYTKKASDKEQQEMQALENKLTLLILSGESPERFSAVIAKWASKTAGFPEAKAELWQKTIRSCFSINKMFATPLVLLKEIKEYCELNIEVGSIHFHTLSGVLREGIHKHVDYLGGTNLALGYSLLELDSDVGISLADKARAQAEQLGEQKVADIITKAPSSYPKKEDYDSSLAFLRAKLAYRTATIAISVAAQAVVAPTTSIASTNIAMLAVLASTNIPDKGDITND